MSKVNQKDVLDTHAKKAESRAYRKEIGERLSRIYYIRLGTLFSVTIGVGILLYILTSGIEPSSVSNWSTNEIETLDNIDLSADQRSVIDTLFAERKLLVSKKAELMIHASIVIVLSFLGGLLGGAANHAILLNTFEMRRMRFSLFRVYSLAIAAAFVVPLFLSIIGSNILKEATSNPHNYYLYFGFCILAAYSARKFLLSIGEQALVVANESKAASEVNRTASQRHDVQINEQKKELESKEKEIQKLEQSVNNTSSALFETREKLKEALRQNTIHDEAQSIVTEQRLLLDKYDRKLSECVKRTKKDSGENLEELFSYESRDVYLRSIEQELNSAFKMAPSIRIRGTLGNTYYRLYQLTGDKSWIRKAIEILRDTTPAEFEEVGGANSQSRNISLYHYNLACYIGLLNGDWEEIKSHLRKSILSEPNQDFGETRYKRALSDEDLKNYWDRIKDDEREFMSPPKPKD